MKPNVLFIVDSFEQGGSERQALQLLRQLHESGQCNVHLAVLQDRGSLRAEAEAMGIGEIHEYPLTSFYDLNFLKQLRRLRRYIKAEQDQRSTHPLFLHEHLRDDRRISFGRACADNFKRRDGWFPHANAEACRANVISHGRIG